MPNTFFQTSKAKNMQYVNLELWNEKGQLGVWLLTLADAVKLGGQLIKASEDRAIPKEGTDE